MQTITSLPEWERILELSMAEPVIIYKHSTLCAACDRAERELVEGMTYKEIAQPVYKVVVQNNRELSDRIAADTRVAHESPQVIIISRGRACFVADHSMIDFPTLSMQAELIRKTRDELLV